MAEIFKKYQIPSSVMEQDESSMPGLVEVVGVKNLNQIQESVMFDNAKRKKAADKWALTMENFGKGLVTREEAAFKHKSIHESDKGDRLN